MRLFLFVLALPALAAATTTASADNTAPQYSLGAWLAATASEPTLGVLEVALREHFATTPINSNNNNNNNAQKICFEQVHAIEQQIVNGINFRYHVTGCALASEDNISNGDYGSIEPLPRSGRCVRACGPQQQAFQVTVFCQPWTQTTQVLSIVSEDVTAYA